MNHNVTLSIAAVVAAMALTAVAFAIPQQALAHYRHHNNHNSKESPAPLTLDWPFEISLMFSKTNTSIFTSSQE